VEARRSGVAPVSPAFLDARLSDPHFEEVETPLNPTELPMCRKCREGTLLPLSDYGRDGAPITFKAWVCSNPDCGFNLRIDNGEISFGRSVGPSHHK
jgi:hypothetical protein